MAKESRDIPKAKLSGAGVKRSLSLLKFVSAKDRWLFALGTLCLAFTAVTLIMFPKLLGELVDGSLNMAGPKLKSNVNTQAVQKVAMGFVWLFLAQAVFSFLRIILYVKVTENLVYELRNRLYKSVIFQKMQFFHSQRTGDLLSRFSADIGQIQDAYTTNIAQFLRQMMTIIGGGVYIFIVSPKLALYMLITVPVVVVISLFFGKFIRKVSRKVQDLAASNNVVVEETLSGVQNVKAFANEQYELTRFEASSDELRKESIYRGYLRGAFSSFIIICLFGSIVFLIFLGLGFVKAGEMGIGELIQFMLLTGFVGGGIGGLAEVFIQLQKTIGAVDRVLELIEMPGEEFDMLVQPYKFTDKLEFENVDFTYPSRQDTPVLHNINFEIVKGQTVALVGHSGSGKSTLVNLLYRFYQPNQGRIMVDGQPLENIDLKAWRSSLALVPQEVMLFGGSIYDNIAYGRPTASYDEVMDVAKQAHVHEFVQNFGEGYETLVGDRGVKLSGGQKQRVAIARAMLANPELLILDEATSSLDSRNESLVQEALDRLLKGRTALVIAHRLSTIKSASNIIVLQSGNIVEMGKHQDLLAIGGVYNTMVSLQNLKQAD